MAQRKVQVRFCDSCIKDTRATTTVRFSFAGADYTIDLCEKHADAIQRDIMSWARLATEIERPSAFMRPDVIREHTRRDASVVAFNKDKPPAEKSPSPSQESGSPTAPPPVAPLYSTGGMNVPATAKNWTLSEHAKEQLEERGPKYGFTREDVFLCCVQPEWTNQSSTAKGDCVQHFRGNVQVIVNPQEKTVVTVLPRSTREFDAEDSKYARPKVQFSHTEELVSAGSH